MTSHRPTSSTLYRLALLALVLVAFALRLHRLDAESFWYDEGVTAYVAGLNPVALTRWTAADIQPPLYYYVVAAWGRLAGWSEWALRAPSVFFGTLTVPLLAMVAMRLFSRHGTALLTATIATVHPFLIYYSQEARNYALLLALGIAGAYCLLLIACWGNRGDAGRGIGRRWWVVYTLVATAAMYTHYFAAFLILALAMIALLCVPRASSPRRQLVALLTSHLVVLILYTPWLFVMLRQFGGDASYLPGPFRLDQALAQLATSAVYGETYLPWALGAWIPLTITTLLALVALLRSNRAALLITALWIAVPTAGVLALAGVVPKFNVRYASLALPGLILLWSGGLSRLPNMTISTLSRRQQFTHHASRITNLLALLLLAACFLYANRLWADPSFITRSQWREVAAYIRDHRQPSDAVVLSSGHAWPVWEYYAPDIPSLRLPDIDVLDVNQALGYTEAGEILLDGLDDANRVWLVAWQNEVLDPMAVVPLHLSRAGQLASVDASFWHIDLSRFDEVDGAAIDPAPPQNLRIVLADVNLGDQLLLLGHEATGDYLRLFWQLAPGVNALDANYELAGEITVEREGSSIRYDGVSDRRLTGYLFPTSRWRPGQVAVSQMPLRADINGALPGDYTLRLVVYEPGGDPAGLDVLDEAGNPRGKRIALPIQIETPLLVEHDEPTTLAVELSTVLIGQSREREAEPGQSLRLQIWWKAHGSVAETPRFALRWLRNDEIIVEKTAEVDGADGVWSQLAAGDSFREVRLLRPPLDLSPGHYDVEFLRVDSSRAEILWALPITVLPSTRSFVLPKLARSVEATFSDSIELTGLLDPLPNQLAPSAPLSLALAWRALDAPPADYSVTLQFLDEAGQPVAQADAPLPNGSRSWLAEEVVTQTVELLAPEAAGTYRLIAAVYDPSAPNLSRLATESGADFVELGRVGVGLDSSE